MRQLTSKLVVESFSQWNLHSKNNYIIDLQTEGKKDLKKHLG
jgi:hypothetical protein